MMMSATAVRHVGRGERLVLTLIATASVTVAAAAATAIGRAAFAVFAAEVTTSMPMTGARIAGLTALEGISVAEQQTALVTMTGLPGGTRWLLLLETALPALGTIGVCAVAWWLGVSLMRARPFRRAMSTAIGTAACLVVAGGVFGQLAGSIGRAAAVEHLAAADASVYDFFPAFLIDMNLAPLGWGFALALVAAAFEIGERLQRDAEGLV